MVKESRHHLLMLTQEVSAKDFISQTSVHTRDRDYLGTELLGRQVGEYVLAEVQPFGDEVKCKGEITA
jgi:hypothetical protein